MCPNGACEASMNHCNLPTNIRVVRTHTLKTNENEMAIKLFDQSDNTVGVLYTSYQIYLQFKGVALSEIEDTRLDIDKIYDPLFYNMFSSGIDDVKPRDFVRSAIILVDINAQDSRLKYKKSIKLHLNTDIMKMSHKFRRIPKHVSLQEVILPGQARGQEVEVLRAHL